MPFGTCMLPDTMPKTPTPSGRLLIRRRRLQARLDLQTACIKKRQRSLDTRKKVLLGALLLAWMDKQPKLRRQVQQALPQFLTRQVDRDVFGLPPQGDRPPENAVADWSDPDPSIV